MGSNRTNQEIATYTAKTIQTLQDYLNELVESGDPHDSRADKIAQWLEVWTKYLKREKQFNPKHLPAFKRGSVIFANLGFNVGKEYGGLHYAIVLNKDDSRSNSLLHILPLTSVKETTNLNKLKYFQHPIGNEIYKLLTDKLHNRKEAVNLMQRKFDDDLITNNTKLSELNKLIDSTEDLLIQLESQFNKGLSPEKALLFKKQLTVIVDNNTHIKNQTNEVEKQIQELKEFQKQLDREEANLNKLKNKISNMKQGSIVLLNQITTISKMRLYDPKNTHSIFTDIVLSSNTMDDIDKALQKII